MKKVCIVLFYTIILSGCSTNMNNAVNPTATPTSETVESELFDAAAVSFDDINMKYVQTYPVEYAGEYQLVEVVQSMDETCEEILCAALGETELSGTSYYFGLEQDEPVLVAQLFHIDELDIYNDIGANRIIWRNESYVLVNMNDFVGLYHADEDIVTSQISYWIFEESQAISSLQLAKSIPSLIDYIEVEDELSIIVEETKPTHTCNYGNIDIPELHSSGPAYVISHISEDEHETLAILQLFEKKTITEQTMYKFDEQIIPFSELSEYVLYEDEEKIILDVNQLLNRETLKLVDEDEFSELIEIIQEYYEEVNVEG